MELKNAGSTKMATEARVEITDDKGRFHLNVTIPSDEAALIMEYALRLTNYRKQREQSAESKLEQDIKGVIKAGNLSLSPSPVTPKPKANPTPSNNSKEKK